MKDSWRKKKENNEVNQTFRSYYHIARSWGDTGDEGTIYKKPGKVNQPNP